MHRNELKKASRIVIKVGTSSIADDKGRPDAVRIGRLVDQLSRLCRQGREMLLVSSGAVGTGMSVLNQIAPPTTLDQKQAFAAVGQGRLIGIYEDIFSKAGLQVAQVLLTPAALEHPMKHENTFRALRVMLDFGVVPILNANDTLACEGFRFGDNDSLSARIAEVIDADLLIILSDVDGLYQEDPRVNPGAILLETVTEITPAMEDNSRNRGTGISTGGMFTKLQAARQAIGAGIPMVIAAFDRGESVERILEGERVGTLFLPCQREQELPSVASREADRRFSFSGIAECPLAGLAIS